MKVQTTFSATSIPDVRRVRMFSSRVTMGCKEERQVIQMPEYEIHSTKSTLPIDNHNKSLVQTLKSPG